MTKKTVLIIVLTIISLTCIRKSIIDYKNIEGFYTYLIVDDNGNVIDSLFATARIQKTIGKDTVFVDFDIWGLIIGTNKEFLGLWDVQEDQKKLIPKFFTRYSTRLKRGDTWSVKEEVGFHNGTFDLRFSCIAVDTIINVFPRNPLKNIVVIEEKNWADIGGAWVVRLYGLNEKRQLAYYTSYMEDARTKKIIWKNNSLVLQKFIPKKGMTPDERKRWISKNSNSALKWFISAQEIDEIRDIPPPEIE